MRNKFCVLILCVNIFGILQANQCPAEFIPPSECFSINELQSYGHTAIALESLYDRYVNILADSGLVVSGDEAGVDFFYGGDLPQKVRKRTYYGNSVTSFLSIVLQHACKEQGMTGKEVLYCMNQMNVSADFFEVCQKYDFIDCSARKTNYQPIDGICVNHYDPYVGAINTPFSRITPNSYDDSIHEPRTSVNRNKLPSARLLSSGIKTLTEPFEIDSFDNMQNDLLNFYIQMVFFDISKTLKAQTWDGNYGFECCACDGKDEVKSRFFNRYCMPIEIPANDPIFKGKKCMNFIRAAVTHDNCQFKEASILNAVTHYLDLDFIYVAANIKAALKNGGKFKEDERSIHRTIVLGDERLVWFPHFAALAIVYIKFHNRVFDEFDRLYPELQTNVKFYETRRFVVAVYQATLLTEVLPLIVSDRSEDLYRLMDSKRCYSSKISPEVPVEMEASVARYFHTFIHDSYMINFKNGTSAKLRLRDLHEDLAFQEHTGVITGTFDRVWNIQKISHQASNYMFSSDGRPTFDMRALDIQSERDLGVGTYCDTLYHFNITEGVCIKKFSDFEPFITDPNINFLKYAYEDPCDIDLGVGGSMHASTDGGLLSDIFDKIFSITFKKLKCGDPYFYTNSLKKDQKDFVEGFSFKDILCLTIPDLPPTQDYVFVTPGENNTKNECTASLNLDFWKLTVDPRRPVTDLPTSAPDTTIFKLPTDFVTEPPQFNNREN